VYIKAIFLSLKAFKVCFNNHNFKSVKVQNEIQFK